MGTEPRRIFVAGGTGYIGRPLVAMLVARGHTVRVLMRAGSEARVAAGAIPVRGDALRHQTYEDAIDPGDTIVHLIGTPHPAPWKSAEFERVDWGSAREIAAAALRRDAAHIVYLSVAQPAPVMKSYIAVRARCEERFGETGIPFTALRPWYVLGPGHRWPWLLVPLYALAERIPPWRASARRLGLVTRRQMLDALVNAVEAPPARERCVEVPEIRAPLSAADPFPSPPPGSRAPSTPGPVHP